MEFAPDGTRRTFPKKGGGAGFRRDSLPFKALPHPRRSQEEPWKRQKEEQRRREGEEKQTKVEERRRMKNEKKQERMRAKEKKRKEKKRKRMENDGGIKKKMKETNESEEMDSDDVPEEDMYADGETFLGGTSFSQSLTGRLPDNDDKEKIEEDEDGEGEGSEVEEDEETDISAIRREMADMPLSKLREMKEKLGLKLFNAAYFETKKANVEDDDKQKQPAKERTFARENEKRPREVSSKKPVSRFRPIYQEKKNQKFDPRFEGNCGEFDEQIFETNYQFLDEIRQNEMKELKNSLLEAKRAGDVSRVQYIKNEIRKIENREKSKKEKEMERETIRELKKENMERMKKGLKPVFKKRADVKMRVMEKKFEQLKKEKKVDKYMQRKAKRSVAKEKKRMRTEEGEL